MPCLNILLIFLRLFFKLGAIKGLGCIVLVPYSNALLYFAELIIFPTISPPGNPLTSVVIPFANSPKSVAGYSPGADA